MEIIKSFRAFTSENSKFDDSNSLYDIEFTDETDNVDVIKHKVDGTDDIIESFVEQDNEFDDLEDIDTENEESDGVMKHKINGTDDIVESYSELDDYELKDVFSEREDTEDEEDEEDEEEE